MAQFMLGVFHCAGVQEAGTAYDDPQSLQEALAAVDALNSDLEKQGALLFAGGLTPPETGTWVDGTGAEVITTDATPAKGAQSLGGFWIIEAADEQEAREWAARGSKACGQRVELRALADEAA